MEVNELKRGLKFSDPEANAAVRHRDTWRWGPAEVVITNIRKYGEEPEDIIIYYKDNGGNKWKADADWFLSNYGDFLKEAGNAPATPAEQYMSDPNPAAIPDACPYCGGMIDRPMYYSSLGNDEAKEYTCPRCGNTLDLSTAGDEEILMEPELFNKTSNAKLLLNDTMSTEEQFIIDEFLEGEGVVGWHWLSNSAMLFENEDSALEAKDVLDGILDKPTDVVFSDEFKQRIFVEEL